MKKFLLSLTAIAALFVTSCVNEALTDDVQVTGAEGLVTFTVEAPEFGSRTLIGNGQKATSLVYAVYDKNWEYLTEGTAEFQNLVANVSLRLVNNKEYNFVFWASVPGNTYYTLDTRTATVEVSYEGEANDENRDAFFGQLKGLVVDGTMNESVKLYRPFAQVNWGTNDVAEAKIGGFDITTAGTAVYEAEAYTSLSLKDGAVDGLTTVTFAANELVSNSYVDENDAAEQLVTKAGASYTWLAMNYLLWTADEGTLTYNKLTIEDNLGQKVVVSYPNANVRRNWRTNLVGSLLTDQTNITVEIVPGFEDQYDVDFPEFDNVDEGLVVDAEGNYYVSSANGFVKAMEIAPATAVITLTKDIDLTGVAYTPRTFSKLTFDGQGNTISGVEVVGQTQAALFGKTWNFNIKNLTIANSTFTANNIDGEDAAGAFIGFYQAFNAGSKLTNCHVNNCVIGSAKFVGGLVAYKDGANYSFAVENCSVKNSTLVSNYSEDGGVNYKGHCGGLVGYHAGDEATTLTNCTVENNTFDVKGPRCGLFIGTAQKNIAVSGGVADNSGLTALCGTINRITDWSNVQSTYSNGGLVDEVLNAGGDVVLGGDTAVNTDETEADSGYRGKTGVMVNGNELDLNGNTLSVENSAWGTYDCVITTKGGTIKNGTVSNAMRGIFMTGATADLYIDNVKFENVIYTFNSDDGNTNYGVYVSNSTLNGWTSFSAAHKEVIFTNCSFGKGNGYAFCRPYQPAVFDGCAFSADFAVDSSVVAGHIFRNCTFGGEPLTSANIGNLVSTVANVTVE